MSLSPTYSRILSKPIVHALWEGKKIQAIKLLRDEQNLGLKDAKHVIDQYIQQNSALRSKFSLYQPEDARSIIFVILMALGIVVVIYFL